VTIFVPGTGRTYGDLQSRIADDLNRTDLTNQIKENILLAIAHYRSERFWFNETSTTLTATVSQSYVTAPTDILRIDNLYIKISGKNIALLQQDLNSVVEYRPTTNGRPRAFCYYQNRFELDMLSDAAYAMPLYYVKELSVLSSSSDTNGWTTAAEDLIVFHAEKMLYANVIKDMEKAQAASALETAALTQLRSLGRARTTTGYTKAVYL
jgi:hypothetical protein